jgi:hypothetical protein
MKNSTRRKGIAAGKTHPRALIWLVLASALCGPSHPTATTVCAGGEPIVALELSVGAYHVLTSAFRCTK